MQVKAVETMVDTHRQELQRTASAKDVRWRDAPMKEVGATQRSAAGVPVTGGRAVRRAVATRIGSWLIHAGVRLGGAPGPDVVRMNWR
jgi:hypothetical protein